MTSPLDPGRFGPDLFGDAAISDETRAFNAMLVRVMTPLADWWDVGA